MNPYPEQLDYWCGKNRYLVFSPGPLYSVQPSFFGEFYRWNFLVDLPWRFTVNLRLILLIWHNAANNAGAGILINNITKFMELNIGEF